MSCNSLQSFKSLFTEKRFPDLATAYQALSAPMPEEHFWGGIGLIVVGRKLEAFSALEKSLEGGYRGAAALLASFATESGDVQQAQDLLDSIEPFEDLDPLPKAFAYRERGQLLETLGQFAEASRSYLVSWAVFQNFPGGESGLGFAGQLLAWSLELLGRSTDALEIIRNAKRFSRSDRRVQLLYLQILTAARVGQLEEAHETLEELKTFIPNNPHLQGLASNAAGTLAYVEKHYKEAILHFENAVIASSGAHTEAAFSANLFACVCALALKDPRKATLYLERAKEEFIVIEPFLTPAYAKRARAGLLLRQGTLDVHFGRETAVEQLQNSLRLYKELGLPLGQAQALLQLAEWFARPVDESLPDEDWESRDERQATWLVQQAHDLRKSFQDAASYRAELDLAPDARRFYMAAVAGSGISQTPLDIEKIFAEIFGVIRTPSEAKPDLFFADLRRLVFSGAHEDAVRIVETILLPKPLTQAWGGLSWLLARSHDRACERWETLSIKPKQGHKQENEDADREQDQSQSANLAFMRSIVHCIEQTRRAPIQFHAFGKPEICFLHDRGGLRGVSLESVEFSSPQSYALFAMLIESHAYGVAGAELEYIFKLIWTEIPTDQALIEFEKACQEINDLGSKPRFVRFALASENNRYRLVGTGLKTFSKRELRNLNTLPIGYWPLEFEARLGFCDLSFAWALSEYKTFFEGANSAWVLQRRHTIELELFERGIKLIQVLQREGDLDGARILARNLSKLKTLKADGPPQMRAAAKGEIQRLANEIADGDLLPGQLRIKAKGYFRSEEDIDDLQRGFQTSGWYVVCENLNKRIIKPHITAQMTGRLGTLASFDNPVVEATLEIFSAKLIRAAEAAHATNEIMRMLSTREITDVHVLQRQS